MHPTPSTPGPTGVTVLPDATRDEMLKAAGLNPSAHWPEVNRWGHGPDDAVSNAAGEDAGWDDPEQAARELEERGYLMDGGWHAVEPTKGYDRGEGTTSHRGVLHPEEYVDLDELQAQVEQALGFTYEQVRSVYRQGPLNPDQRELRASIDARLLALSLSGANMVALGRVLGLPIKEDGHCRVIENALTRARAAVAA